MILGLLRIFLLTAAGIGEAYGRSSDRVLPWKEVRRQTLGWLFPLAAFTQDTRRAYSLTSFLFHGRSMITPIFLVLTCAVAYFNWHLMGSPSATCRGLPDVLTIATGLGLFFGRALHRGARTLSRLQAYTWPVLLVIPDWVTGTSAPAAPISPQTYQGFCSCIYTRLT